MACAMHLHVLICSGTAVHSKIVMHSVVVATCCAHPPPSWWRRCRCGEGQGRRSAATIHGARLASYHCQHNAVAQDTCPPSEEADQDRRTYQVQFRSYVHYRYCTQTSIVAAKQGLCELDDRRSPHVVVLVVCVHAARVTDERGTAETLLVAASTSPSSTDMQRFSSVARFVASVVDASASPVLMNDTLAESRVWSRHAHSITRITT